MSGARNSPFGVRTKLMLFYLPLSSRLRRRSSEGGLLGSDKSFRGELRQAPLRLGATGLGGEQTVTHRAHGEEKKRGLHVLTALILFFLLTMTTCAVSPRSSASVLV